MWIHWHKDSIKVLRIRMNLQKNNMQCVVRVEHVCHVYTSWNTWLMQWGAFSRFEFMGRNQHKSLRKCFNLCQFHSFNLFSSTWRRHPQTIPGVLWSGMFWWLLNYSSLTMISRPMVWGKFICCCQCWRALISLKLSFQCYLCPKTTKEMESLVDLSTKAHYGFNLQSSPWNPWAIPATWCREIGRASCRERVSPYV